jgi:hypothetical protein
VSQRGAPAAAARWAERWRAATSEKSARWAADGSARWARRRRAGIDRCRHWDEEGSHRPGEIAPPSWFHIGSAFAIAWYRVAGSVPQAWYLLAGWSCRLLAGAVYRLLAGVARVLARIVPREP